MMGEIIKMFSYPFMARAFLAGGLIALCSALLGVSLVLKKYSMIFFLYTSYAAKQKIE